MLSTRYKQGPARAGWLAAAVGLILGLLPVAVGSTVREALPGGEPDWSVTTGPPADRVLRERARTLLGDPGAVLRAALESVERGDRSHAIWLLEQLVQTHPSVADYGARYQVQWLQEDGHAEQVVRVARAALTRDPETPLAGELYSQLGTALYELGSREAAHEAWRLALDHSRDEDLRAQVLLSVAASEERAGLDEDAVTTYKLIWYAHPVSQQAKVADHRLELLAEHLGRPLLAGTDWRRRGDRLYRKRLNEEALAAYDEALSLELSPSETLATKTQRARTLFRLRRYPEAVDAFASLPNRDDNPIWHARALARSDRVPESIEAFEALAVSGRGQISERAAFLAATLLEGRGFVERARSHYEKLAHGRRRAEFADASLWRLGWSAYGEGEYELAVSYLEQLIDQKRGDEVGQLRARYWRARSLEKLGQGARAKSEFGAIARDFPLSYYGWRAQARVGPAAGPKAQSQTLSEGEARLGPDALARPRILLEAGLLEEARAEVRQLASRARSLTDRLKLAAIATGAGDYYRAHRLVVDAYSNELVRGPIGRYRELWQYAWPSAFALEVNRATDWPNGVDPALVYSIMREESGYRAEVISPVGARGLLQIMTTTGETLARERGIDLFEADDLFLPSTNIALGAHYLSQLSQEFDGRLSASIASYNAGPEAVREWAAGPEVDDRGDDEWVESIPYEQTRAYVKRVLRSLHVYRMLY